MIKVREAQIKDIPVFYKFICELEAETFDFDQFSEIFARNLTNHKYLVAEFENQVVGILTLHVQPLLHHCGLVGEIQEFYISADFRNKGIGKLLVNEIKKYASTLNLTSLEVTTNKKRAENVNIYSALGFNLSHNKFTYPLK